MIPGGDQPTRGRPRGYGPHDPREAPELVSITLGSYPKGRHYRDHGPYRELKVAVPKALRDQRAALNTLAHEAGREDQAR